MKNDSQQLNNLRKEIFDKQQELHKLLKEVEPEEIANYSFQDVDGNKVELSQLFGTKNELLLIHNMGKRCVYCTMWADGMRGYTRLIEDRMTFVLSSPDAPEVLKKFSEDRDWNFNCVSFNGSSFAHDMGFAYDKEGQTWYQPGFSALFKEGDKIFRKASDYFGPGDYFCPPWHFFEYFPNGPDGWEPKYKY